MDHDLIKDCVHCGFCLPTCPSYVVFDEEMDSPRGRIVLMDNAREQGVSPVMRTHIDRCLGCLACVTACPSGVQYGKLIELTRPEVQKTRPLAQRLFLKTVLSVATRPGLVRMLAPVAPRVKARRALHRLDELTPARGERRGRIGLLQGCVQRAWFGDVNAATVRVLAAEGWEVYAPRKPRCCGALAHHAGVHDERARNATEEAFRGCDFLVTNVAGCGSALKEYELDVPVRDVHELLMEFEPRARRRHVAMKVAYHDACHLAHAQKVRAQPRALLRSIPGIELVEPAEWEICCGSAGIYNVVQPRAARQLGQRKAANLLATGAEAIAAANPGCSLQIAAYCDLPVLHPMTLLDRAIS
jgi:glycolate oxidase iron-sulfur subunit